MRRLVLGSMDPEQAAEWLLMHQDDGEADGPFTPQQLPRVAAILGTPTVAWVLSGC